jgi:hypothetical protein
LGNKFLFVVCRSQARLQLVEGVVVESKICRDEAFLQNCHSGEQTHGFSFHFIWRNQQDLTLSFEKSSGDSAQNVLSKRDGAVLERDVD